MEIIIVDPFWASPSSCGLEAYPKLDFFCSATLELHLGIGAGYPVTKVSDVFGANLQCCGNLSRTVLFPCFVPRE
jgi:hypothetical protein